MLEWFTTIPGILIICGVILLVIAIILFVVGSKKSKKKEASNTNVEENIVPAVTSAESNIVNPTEMPSVSQEITETNVDTTNNSVENSVIGVSEPVQIEEPVAPVFNASVSTDINNEAVINSTPVINMPEENVKDETMNSTIYGGEMPTVDFTVPEEKPVTIYGGNDPLEATQTLPKMEETHVPYGGNYKEVRIVEPAENNPIPTPVEETVVEMPTVEPAIVNIPVEEPVVPEVNAIPTPMEESAVEMPTVEPAIVNIPVEEPVVPEVNAIPTPMEESAVEMPSVEPTIVNIPVEEPVVPEVNTTPIAEEESVVEEL